MSDLAGVFVLLMFAFLIFQYGIKVDIIGWIKKLFKK